MTFPGDPSSPVWERAPSAGTPAQAEAGGLSPRAVPYELMTLRLSRAPRPWGGEAKLNKNSW